ncbi:MAG: zinc dependent phospholipase C family protein [Flavobacteriales bacterium]|nr:zinc dependent phospholipase C family protein [Flavobacteriales bacterium]
MAVFSLPPEMVGLYKDNIDYLTEHAVDPDKRRYSTEGEACKHYIDVDHYHLTKPFEVIPKRWKEAVEKFTEDTLKAYGVLPWNIQLCLYFLTRAFQEKDVNSIMYWSTNIGHYVADSHVPLHTTENYNGQMTNQKGIHGLWETRIPELMADKYDRIVGRAIYLERPLDASWETIQQSFGAKDSVLLLESQLNDSFSSDHKYGVIQRGASNIKTYSDDYVAAYNDLMNGMVERRFRLSIYNVASFWYTAWVNAGQPNLDDLVFSYETVEKRKEDNGKVPKGIRQHSH